MVGALADEVSSGSAGEVVPFTVLEHLNTVLSSVVVGLSSVPRSEGVSLPAVGPDPAILSLDIVVADPSVGDSVASHLTSNPEVLGSVGMSKLSSHASADLSSLVPGLSSFE